MLSFKGKMFLKVLGFSCYQDTCVYVSHCDIQIHDRWSDRVSTYKSMVRSTELCNVINRLIIQTYCLSLSRALPAGERLRKEAIKTFA